MQKLVRIVAIAALIGLGFLAWRYFFPSPERVIRSRLVDLAQTVSFEHGEGNISKIYKADKVGDFFTLDVEVTVDVRGHAVSQTFNSRTEIKQALLAAQSRVASLKVRFPDINVVVQPDGETAIANVTAQVNVANEPDFLIQELNLTLKKVDGKWLIYKIETVKTLS